MASTVKLVSGQPVVIEPIAGELTFVTIGLDLGGAVGFTLTPTCRVADSDMATADSIEYFRPSATQNRFTAPIAASGIYEFFIENKELILTPTFASGEPKLYYASVIG